MKRLLHSNISITRLARLSRLSPATLRYYEKIGLIQSVSRQERGTRHFPERVLKTLKAIGLFQAMGFTLREVLDLQQMPQNHAAHQQRFRRVLANKLREQEIMVKEAVKRERSLRRSIKACTPQSNFCACDLGMLLGSSGEAR